MTRFATWPRWAAALVLGLVAAAVVAAALPHRPAPGGPARAPTPFDDRQLYRNVVDRVSGGEDYYAAARAEHRAHAYPLAPAVVFREPTMTWVLAALRYDWARSGALIGLAALALVALRRRLDDVDIAPRLRLPAALVIATGVGAVGAPDAAYLHEFWAGILIALSMALHRPGRWIGALALGLGACLFRELSLPYLAAMAVFAAWERRWPELLGWSLGGVGFLGAYAVHLSAAAAGLPAGESIPTSWLGLGGVPFLVETARWNLLLHPMPTAAVALALALALVGLCSWRDPWIGRCALIVGGYTAAFLVVGRPDNDYWGILYAPLAPLGLVLAPMALRDLVGSLSRPGAKAAGLGISPPSP